MPGKAHHTPITGTPNIRTALNAVMEELDEAIGDIGIAQSTLSENSVLSGATLTGSAWSIRTISTGIATDHAFASLNLLADTFVLESGTWLVRVSASVYNVGLNRLRMYNVTQASVVRTSLNHEVGGDMDCVRMVCIVTANGTDSFRFEHYAETTDSDGQGESQPSLTNQYLQSSFTRIS